MSYIGAIPEDSIVINNKPHVATEGQTVFPCIFDDYVEVTMNGRELSSVDGDDYTKNNGVSITLALPAKAGDIISIDGYQKVHSIVGENLVFTDTVTSSKYTLSIVSGVVTPVAV